MKGVDLMVISLVVSYLLMIVLMFVGGVIYYGVVTYKFAKSHAINVGEYLDLNRKYLDSRPYVKWYVSVVRVLLTPVWFPPRMIKLVKDMETAYLDSNK